MCAGPPKVSSDFLLGGSGDLVSLRCNGPYRAYLGLLWWLIGGYELDLRSQLIIQVWAPVLYVAYDRLSGCIRIWNLGPMPGGRTVDRNPA